MVAVRLVAANGMNRATGYGKLEAGLLSGLEQTGAEVRVVKLSWLDANPQRLLALDVATGRSDVTVVVGSPSWGELIRAHPFSRREAVWLYTMSETNRVSREWVEAINDHFDGVFVPCPPLVDVYRESGVRVPVMFAPMGVERPEDSTQRRKEAKDAEMFTFLAYSLGDMRKGADLVMHAFNRLFGRDPHYQLIIKARDNARLSWLAGLDEPNMRVIGGETSEAEWWALLAQTDCFVFPSRGEGFGLPPREATLMGVPTIATQWLGLWDVDCWGLPVGVRDMRPAQFDDWEANAEGSLWAEPDRDELDAAMRYVVERAGDARFLAQEGAEYLESWFNWERTGRMIERMIHDG